MGHLARITLFGLAIALVTAVSCFALLCREKECFDRLAEDARNAFRGSPASPGPQEPPAPPSATVPEEEATPAKATRAPTASDGFYERLADLKRRFAEGATIQRVSRPAPRRAGAPPAGSTGGPDPRRPGVQHLLRWKLYLEGLPEGFLGDPDLDPLHPDPE